MEIVQAIILGIVQGLTEFLPVSSTGHLMLAQWFFGMSSEQFGLAFDAALHLGTLAALLAVFWRDFLALAAGLWSVVRGKSSFSAPAPRQAIAIIVGTVPAVIAGLTLEKAIETTFRSPLVVAASLVVFSGALVWVERGQQGRREVASVNWLDAALIGCAQAVALIPGVSRSGITIAAGMALGLRREDAARFAFLLSAPVIAGAGGKQLIDVARHGDGAALAPIAVGVLASAVVGYIVIRFLLHYLARHSLIPFVVYRVALAAVVAAVYLAAPH